MEASDFMGNLNGRKSLALPCRCERADRHISGMDVSHSTRCAKGEGSLLERLELNQPAAMGLLVQAVSGVRRTLGAMGGVTMRMRHHLVIMDRGTSDGFRGHAISCAHRGYARIGTRQRHCQSHD
jgi:hypothetical protein